MDLTSCKSCGTVLDKDHLHFPEDIYTEDGVNLDLAIFNQRNGIYTPFVSCPVCKGPILKRD